MSPDRIVWFRLEWWKSINTPLACLMLTDLMFRAEEQPAAFIAPIRLIAADIGQSPIDLRFAAWVIANCGNAVTDIAVPVAVKPNRPSHLQSLQKD
jgi:hypothetical protein